jgi:hypothetical protein
MWGAGGSICKIKTDQMLADGVGDSWLDDVPDPAIQSPTDSMSELPPQPFVVPICISFVIVLHPWKQALFSAIKVSELSRR